MYFYTVINLFNKKINYEKNNAIYQQLYNFDIIFSRKTN